MHILCVTSSTEAPQKQPQAWSAWEAWESVLELPGVNVTPYRIEQSLYYTSTRQAQSPHNLTLPTHLSESFCLWVHSSHWQDIIKAPKAEDQEAGKQG